MNVALQLPLHYKGLTSLVASVLFIFSLRSSDSPDETMQCLDDLVKRHREFGDLLLSSDIKQVPIGGMSFGMVDLPERIESQSNANNELVSVIFTSV